MVYLLNITLKPTELRLSAVIVVILYIEQENEKAEPISRSNSKRIMGHIYVLNHMAVLYGKKRAELGEIHCTHIS